MARDTFDTLALAGAAAAAAAVVLSAVLLLTALLRAARTVPPEKASTRELTTSWAVLEELKIAAAWASLAVWKWTAGATAAAAGQ